MDKINDIRFNQYDSPVFGLDFKYYDYLYTLSGIGLILFASLFIGMVFVLMTMATLALKLLSMLAEDRGKFATIWRLGASETMIGKSLFSQMFFYFFAPFAVPLALCIPISTLLSKIFESYNFASSLISLQILTFIGIMFLLFGLYFLITFLLGLKDVQRHLRPSD